MKFIADFHIHSRFSRATSSSLNIKTLEIGAREKGIQLLGTGDFTHPQWFAELKRDLREAESGFFTNKNSPFSAEKQPRFILTSEISCIYKKNDQVRKIHALVIAPSFEIAEKINAALAKIGNIKSDGRPILGIDVKELLKIIIDISSECLFVPAHCMTPWFSIFGSKSGFDSVQECFEEYSNHIYALETGLSADPAMLWRLPDGRRLTLISNSDAHSAEKIGREANVFNCDFDYNGVMSAIKENNPEKFLYTIEFYPQEGKYYNDGHSNCKINFSPDESKKNKNECPVCGQSLIIGVLNRIETLADKPAGFIPEKAVPFKNIIPLKEIIAHVLGQGTISKAVSREYQNLIKAHDNEFNILLDADTNEIARTSSPEIAQGIEKARKGEVELIPGYDGIFGRIKIFVEPKKNKQQKIL